MQTERCITNYTLVTFMYSTCPELISLCTLWFCFLDERMNSQHIMTVNNWDKSFGWNLLSVPNASPLVEYISNSPVWFGYILKIKILCQTSCSLEMVERKGQTDIRFIKVYVLVWQLEGGEGCSYSVIEGAYAQQWDWECNVKVDRCIQGGGVARKIEGLLRMYFMNDPLLV